MLLNQLQELIKNTYLLEAGQKAYFLQRVTLYPEALQTKMFALLQSGAEKLARTVLDRKDQALQSQKELLHQQLILAEQDHLDEIAAAEALLEEDLAEF